MEILSDLIGKLDFSHGKKFLNDVLVRLGKYVHHPSSLLDVFSLFYYAPLRGFGCMDASILPW
jgi:hypothetical protein